ncbi:unnamed protein product [Sphagnum jensenii]
MSTRCQLKQLTPVVTSQKPLNLMMRKLAPILVALPRGQKLEVVVKGGKAAAPAPVPALAPAKKAPALAPSSLRLQHLCSECQHQLLLLVHLEFLVCNLACSSSSSSVVQGPIRTREEK